MIFFPDKHENLIMTQATETLLISKISFLYVPNKVAIVENYIIKSWPNFLESMQYQATMWSRVFNSYSFWQYFRWRTYEVLLYFWAISPRHTIWLKIDMLVVRAFKNEVKLSLFYLHILVGVRGKYVLSKFATSQLINGGQEKKKKEQLSALLHFRTPLGLGLGLR